MRTRRFAIAVALVVAVLAQPATAAPTWLDPITVSGGNDVPSMELAVAPQGDVMVSWFENGVGTQVAVRPPGGSFATELTPPGFTPLLAFDPSGNGLAVWSESAGIKGAFRPAGGSFGEPFPIALAGPGETNSQPQIVFDGQGNALASWLHSDGRVQVAFRPAGGSFGSSDTISAAGQAAQAQHVAFDGSGNAIAVWSRSDGTKRRIEAAFRPVGGTFAAAAPISEAGQDADSPMVAMDKSGNAIAVWVRPEVNGGLRRMQASFRPAGGTFQATPDTLSPAGGAQGAETPRIAFDSQGNAVAAWMRQFWVEVASRPAGGSFAAAERISPVDKNAWSPRIAFDPSDNALLVWRNTDVTAFSFRPAGGSFSTPFEPISESGASAYTQRIGTDAQGNAAAAWLRTVDGKGHVEVAGFDAAAPVLSNVSFPAEGRVGDPLPFGATVSDVWGPVSTVWNFGDGATADGSSVTHTYAAEGSFMSSVTATDAAGNAASASGSLTVGPALPGSQGADTVSPVLSRLRLVPRRFRPEAGHAARGTTIRVKLSEAARVVFRVQRARPGRRVGGKCRRPARQNRSRPRCVRWVTLRGRITHDGVAGANAWQFNGRLRGRALKPGKHRLVARAKDNAGNRGKPRRARFKIRREP